VQSVKRLQNIVGDFYKYPASYSNNPTQLIDQSELAVNQTVYGLGATCLYPLSAKENFVAQLSNVWDQQIRPGKELLTLEPHRLVFLFDNNLCIYPAERIEDLKVHPRLNSTNYLTQMRNSQKEYFTNRKMKDYSLLSENITTFWTPLRDSKDGSLYGAIGLQVAFERNWNCMPDLLTKEYAAPSFMLVFDSNLTIH
jgi:hypothetical protein